MPSTLDKSIRSAFNRIKSGSGTNQDIKTLIRDHFLQEKQIMTLPVERFNSLLHAEQLLYDLLDPKKTPRVPRAIRGRARSVLRHWPMGSQLEIIAERVPEHFNRSEDPLYTAVKAYDNSK
ncbi:BPSL0761 family protein, partial [Lentibacter algarum]|uniref:BPSL0761 family protein n=1 Tax=Lentibacter algarum TaxID=576131 RepID=UPI0023A8B86A